MAPRRSKPKDSRIRTTLVVAFAIGIYIWKELKRRREQYSTLRLMAPLPPVAQQVVSTCGPGGPPQKFGPLVYPADVTPLLAPQNLKASHA